jgi:type II secretory pathway pseudopilin PulG
MKTNLQSRKAGAFTLIEMVGVLAVIALLAAILVPKVFSAISNARYANTMSSINAVKTAATDYYGKYGKFGGVGGATPTTAQTNKWDDVLVTENFLERPFDCKLVSSATNAAVKIVSATANTVGETYRFELNGTDAIASGSRVVMAVLTGVPIADARELSKRMDGEAALMSPTTGNDEGGRVVFLDAEETTVYIYLVHR